MRADHDGEISLRIANVLLLQMRPSLLGLNILLSKNVSMLFIWLLTTLALLCQTKIEFKLRDC